MLFSCLPASASSHGAPIVARRKTGITRHFTVDIHCHVETAEAAALMRGLIDPKNEPNMTYVNEMTAEVNRAQQKRIYGQLTSVETRLKDMDKTGIDIQAISPAPGQFYYWAEPDLALQTSRLINERIAEICRQYPDRFVGLGMVPMQAPELAVRELERLVKELGLRGVEINTNVAGEELSAGRFRPFFAKAEELGILIFMHPSGFTEGRRLSEHYFINVIGNPLDSTVAVSHLIFGGVLDSYPKLKICVAHGGGFLPAYSGRIDHVHGARPDARRVIKKKPTSYLKKLYFDTIVFTHHQLEYLTSLYGSDHILLGTDYPYDMALPKAVEFVSTAKLTRADKTAVLGGNAAKLLKIRVPAPAARTAPKTATSKTAAPKTNAAKAAAKKKAAPKKNATPKKAPTRKKAPLPTKSQAKRRAR